MEHAVHQLAPGREGRPTPAARTRSTSPSPPWTPSSPWSASPRTKAFPPVSNNWGYFGNPEFDALIADARTTFDGTGRDAALAKLHARIVEEAPFLWVAHDVGPRAHVGASVKGVVQPQSWFIDIATMSMD